VRTKRYTLAVRQLVTGEISGDVLTELFGMLDGLDAQVKDVYLDIGSYNNTCLGFLYAYNYAYIIPGSSGVRRSKTNSVGVGAV